MVFIPKCIVYMTDADFKKAVSDVDIEDAISTSMRWRYLLHPAPLPSPIVWESDLSILEKTVSSTASVIFGVVKSSAIAIYNLK